MVKYSYISILKDSVYVIFLHYLHIGMTKRTIKLKQIHRI